MGQGERAVGGLREEGEKEQGGDAPVPGGAEGGVEREAASSEKEDRTAGWESDDDDEDTEEALTEESEGVVAPGGNAGQGDASSGSDQDEDHEAPPPAPEENPATMAHFELRGFRPARRAIAHATPPSSFRLPFRGRKRFNPSRWPIDDAGDAASGCGNNARHDPAASEAASGPAASAASLGSPSATSRLAAGAPAMANNAVGHGDSNNDALSSTAIRSGSKSSDPERDVSPIHLTRNRSPEMDVAVGKSPSPGDRKSSAESKHVAAAGSCRPPSRSRKRRRPVHYPDTEETVAADHARARRNNADLDEYRACVACASAPEQQRPGGGPEVTDESARVLAIVIILGAALALSAASCVLFYIVSQQSASGGPSDSHEKK